jgi:hypothetical protein
MAEICALSGNLLYLSLVKLLWDAFSCLLMKQIVTLLEAYLFHFDGIFLVDNGCACFFIGIGKTFSAYCW